MDIYEYLKADHKKVDGLFKQFEQAPHSDYKAEIVDFIIDELLLHAESEENTFYKYLEQFEESTPEAKHGEKEHNEIKNLIKKIQQTETLTVSWNNKVLELKDLVQHHVKEEEGPLFNKAKKNLSEEEAYLLKEKMHDYKEKLLAQTE